jgi:DeoR/GlpR family transcriptional regulator of sugar metabolism
MVLADDRILEYLNENGPSTTAKRLHETELFNIGYSAISARLNKMADKNLLKRLGNGVFAFTDQAEAYLDERYHVEKGVYLDTDQADKSNGPTPGEEVSDL